LRKIDLLLSSKSKGIPLAIGVFLILPISGISLFTVHLLRQSDQARQESLLIKEELRRVGDLTSDVEALRQKLGSNPTIQDLEALRERFRRLSFELGGLNQVLKDEEDQIARLKELESLIRDSTSLSFTESLARLLLIDRVISQIDIKENQELAKNQELAGRQIERLLYLILILVLFSAAHLLVSVLLLHKDLQGRVQVQRRLMESERAAQAGSQMKSRFLATVSHEVRTPLNAIISMSDLILRDAPDATTKQRLELVRASGKTLLRIINDILDFSKIESGRIQIEKTDFSLRELVDQSVSAMQVMAAEKQIEITAKVGANVPNYVKGDPDRISQILFNLLSNSLKFTEKGRIEVNLDLESSSDTQRKICLSIQDTGRGIPKDKQNFLFKPFEHHQRGTHGESGTGLGLAITNEIVKAMGGTIHLDSEPGLGTRITIVINLEASDVVTLPETGKPRLHLNDLSHFSGTRVLVAEDNPSNQIIIQKLLEKLGCEVRLVSDGSECLKVLSETSFDLIFMDVQMPVMDGYDASLRIRQIPSLERIPIVAITANATGDDKLKAYSCGMNDFLSKPIVISELNECLSQWFGQIQRSLLNPAARDLMGKLGPSAMLKVVTRFGESIANIKKEGADSIRSGDAESLRRLAHKLRSSALALGGYGVAEQLGHLENSNSNTPITIEAWLTLADEINGFYQKLTTEIKGLHANGTSQPTSPAQNRRSFEN